MKCWYVVSTPIFLLCCCCCWRQIGIGGWVVSISHIYCLWAFCWRFGRQTRQKSGVEAFVHIHRSHRSKYQADMLEMAKLYTYKTARFRKVCSIFKTLPNTLNTYRSFELYQTSIPVYGHAFFISEMDFEGNHHPFKQVLTKHTDNYGHISASLQCAVQRLGAACFRHLSVRQTVMTETWFLCQV